MHHFISAVFQKYIAKYCCYGLTIVLQLNGHVGPFFKNSAGPCDQFRYFFLELAQRLLRNRGADFSTRIVTFFLIYKLS